MVLNKILALWIGETSCQSCGRFCAVRRYKIKTRSLLKWCISGQGKVMGLCNCSLRICGVRFSGAVWDPWLCVHNSPFGSENTVHQVSKTQRALIHTAPKRVNCIVPHWIALMNFCNPLQSSVAVCRPCVPASSLEVTENFTRTGGWMELPSS